MGAGKTAVSRLLKKRLSNSVFLDGDWCWDASPFQVTAETKVMVMDNICHTLCNFIRCSAYDNVIFCWVMHEQFIIDDILSRIRADGVRFLPISLICDANALVARLKKDVDSGLRAPDVIQRSVARIPLYERLDTIKIDVSGITAERAAEIICAL